MLLFLILVFSLILLWLCITFLFKHSKNMTDNEFRYEAENLIIFNLILLSLIALYTMSLIYDSIPIEVIYEIRLFLGLM